MSYKAISLILLLAIAALIFAFGCDLPVFFCFNSSWISSNSPGDRLVWFILCDAIVVVSGLLGLKYISK
jgi:hypothetical protein